MRVLENKPFTRVKFMKNGEIVVEVFQRIELNGKIHNISVVARSRVESAPPVKALVDSALTMLNKKLSLIREACENNMDVQLE